MVVEASADPVGWLPLWTNIFTFPTTLNFNDQQSGVSFNRFYRTRLPLLTAYTKLSQRIGSACR